MRTHRKYVEERDEEERWVRPAGSRGGPERRQHERCVVYHRHLRDIHRREGLQPPGASSARSCPVQGPTPRYRYCSLSLSVLVSQDGPRAEHRANTTMHERSMPVSRKES